MKVVNKNKVILIIGIVFLLLLFVGGTFAYFTVSATNNFGSKNISANLGALGSVSLKAGNNLKLDLTTQDMVGNETDKIYYASSSGTVETPTTEVIGTAQAIGTGIFQCSYKIKVEDKSTKSMYTAFQNMSTKSANQIILTINGKDYDFNTANLFPLTITGKFSNLVAGNNQNITASFKIVNKTGVNQIELADTNIALSFTTEELNCTATGEEEPLSISADELITLADINEIAYDGTTDNNLRYIGANPNNYVYFNCSDYNNPTADTCEKWRIIGAFNNMKTSSGETKTLFKIIRNDSLGTYYWDYKQSGVGSSNSDYGSNDWEDSQLMLILNGVSLGNYKRGYTVSGDYLLDKNNVAIMNISGSYYEGSSKTYIPEKTTTSGYSSTTTVDFSNSGLKNDTTRGIIENVVWKLGGTGNYESNSNGLASHFYSNERGTTVHSGRPTEWTGKIGLMYPSDYGYATSGGSTTNRETCLATTLYNWDSSSDCYNNDWLFMNGSAEWTISPNLGTYTDVFRIDYAGNVRGNYSAINSLKVRPTVYLTSNTVISGGNGSSTSPYTLKVSTN